VAGGDHEAAAKANEAARDKHLAAAKASRKDEYRKAHEAAAAAHGKVAEAHRAEGEKASPSRAEKPAAKGPAEQKSQANSFQKAVASEKVTDVKRWTGDGTNKITTGKLGEHDVFIKEKAPDFKPASAVENHNAIARSAEAMGLGHMVQPAAVKDGNFVTKAAEGKVLRKLSADEVSRIPEEHIVSAALIDHIHRNTDRNNGNALATSDGKLTLIDHDDAHGRGIGAYLAKSGRYVPARSVFFAGGEFGYKSPQEKFADLPGGGQKLVQSLASSDVKSIAKDYGIRQGEAKDVKARAADVLKNGLSKSVKNFGGEESRAWE